MSVAAGMAVMQAMFQAEVDAVVGPKGRHNPDRTAVRHGAENGSVTLGGRRVPVTRPRARTTDGREVPLASYTHFAADDLLSEVVRRGRANGSEPARCGRRVGPSRQGSSTGVVRTRLRSTARSRRPWFGEEARRLVGCRAVRALIH